MLAGRLIDKPTDTRAHHNYSAALPEAGNLLIVGVYTGTVPRPA